MGGGPTQLQKQQAQQQASLANQQAGAAQQQQQFAQNQQQMVNPFYQSRMQNGNPYYANQIDQVSGNVAQAFAPARAQLYQQLGSQQGLPSGFKTQALTDLNSQQARAFDQGLLGAQMGQEQAKQGGAAGIMGQGQLAQQGALGYYGGASGANNSIMNAPLQGPSALGVLGGLAGGIAGGFGGGAGAGFAKRLFH
jgi:hypothetical protein